ncbi:aminoglycoside phosphotransferase family protein [Planctomycetota bacterium]|nr:aminoglycoside phosphotransferase family protein [Planctomycetota bacterium]
MSPPQFRDFIPTQRIGGTAGVEVWSGKDSTGSPAVLKTFPLGRGWQQEYAALRSINKAPLTEVVIPRLLDTSENPPAILMSYLDGKNMESHRFPMSTWSMAIQQAGRFLSQFHAIPLSEDDSLPLSKALPLRLESWIKRGAKWLSPAEIRHARYKVGHGAVFEGHQRVYCHNDFEPRNWIWNPRGLGIIDFEHAHGNHPAFDWVKLEVGLFQKMPELREEFIASIGGTPQWATSEVLDAIIAIHAIGCIVWGSQHGEKSYIYEGRRILDE